MSKLTKIESNAPNRKAQKAVSYLVEKLKQCENKIVYDPGDLVIFRESSVIRYSPKYESSSSVDKARWLLAVSVK